MSSVLYITCTVLVCHKKFTKTDKAAGAVYVLNIKEKRKTSSLQVVLTSTCTAITIDSQVFAADTGELFDLMQCSVQSS